MKTNTITRFFIFSLFLAAVIYSCKEDEVFHQVSAIEMQIHNEMNNYRAEKGQGKFLVLPELFMEARAHSLKMKNDVIEPGYEGLDMVFEDLRSKFGGSNAGAIVELTGLTNAKDIVNLFKDNSSKDSLVLGGFNQAGVGYVSDETNNINYITVLFLNTLSK